MKTEKKKINLTVLSVFLVCGYALAGQTIFLEASDVTYIVVDDMEDYNDRDDIREVWTDGYADVVWGCAPPVYCVLWGGGSGSNLNVSTAVGSPYNGATGPTLNDQAMVLRYDNDGMTYTGLPGEEKRIYNAPYYSEIEANTVGNNSLNIGQNWTATGYKQLSLSFQGHPISDGDYDSTDWPAYTVSGRGRDIGGRHDEFYFFSHYPFVGDGGIQVQLLRMDNTDPWAKAGVMIREKWTPYSKFAAVFMTPGRGVTFQYRSVEDGPTTSITKPGVTAPQYLKLIRGINGVFEVFHSDDGYAWQDVNEPGQAPVYPTIDMGTVGDPNLYVGTAVTSHNANQTCSADITNWSIINPALENWIFGNIGTNDPERLYVALEDNVGNVSVVEHNDTSAATLTSWQEWNIPLTAFTGVDFHSIKKVYIGLGDRDNPVVGGSGTVYIDDIYQSVIPVGEKTYHVDGATGDNTNDGLARGTAFATIQRGINAADDYDTVLVWPGVYNEEIAFWGDAITVKSAAAAAIVETNYGYAFSFFSAEGPDTVLSNFIIRNGQFGIYLINGASPSLRNLTIVNNDFGISAFNGSDPDISNCILWGNYYGDLFRDPVPLEAKYSWVEEEVNPIAHWKLDEGSGATAYDSAGTNDGTIYGATWATGQLNGALDFDGLDDYVDMADTVKDHLETSYTFSIWIKPKTIPGIHSIAAYRRSTSDIGYQVLLQLQHNNSDVQFVVGSLGNNAIASYPDTLIMNTWYHVAGIREENVLNVYVNGVSGIPDSETFGEISPDNFKIGAIHCCDQVIQSFFDGTIDDVRIYDRALSSGEIKQVYQNLAGPGFVDAASGDYHLLSERGRYWPAHDVWVLDDVTSPCIDGGDPAVDPTNERMPNGGRINMGAYGNTAYASMSEWPLKHDSNFDGVVNMLDLAGLALEWLEGDAAPSPWPPPPDTPPAPVPAIISIQAISPSSIMMTASEAFDESGVQYYFEARSPGGHDSGWQDEPNYTDVNLVPGATYCYRVKARDKSINFNETIWSPQVCLGSPPPPDTLAPLPDPMLWDPVVDANGYDGLPREVLLDPFGQNDYGATMRAILATDQAPPGVAPSEVEYYFECQDDSGFDSGWRTVALYPNEDDRRTYTVRLGGSGLAYRFRVKARDASDNLNETGWSAWYPALYVP